MLFLLIWRLWWWYIAVAVLVSVVSPAYDTPGGCGAEMADDVQDSAQTVGVWSAGRGGPAKPLRGVRPALFKGRP